MRKFNGFTLIEFGLVLMLVTLTLAFTIPMFNDYRNGIKKQNLMSQHLDQFQMLTDAAQNWAVSTYDDISDDSSGTVSIDVLKTDNYLPDDFAFQYSGVISQDILGNEFKVFWDKSLLEYMGVEKQRVRLITIADSPLSWNTHPQIFIPNKFADIESQQDYEAFVDNWYNSLLTKATEKGLVAARLKPNSNVVVGPNQSFKFPLPAEFNIPQRSYQRIVFFEGWPDLNDLGGDGTGTGPGTVTENAYSGCLIGRKDRDSYLNVLGNGTATYSINSSPSSSSCPSGTVEFIDLTAYRAINPTQVYSLPGFGTFFASVKKTIVSNLGSLGYYCGSRARTWCNAKNGTLSCNENDHPNDFAAQEAHTQACNIEPIWQYDVVLSLGGSEYLSWPIYQYGYYKIGNVGSTTYEVATTMPGTSRYIASKQHIICCPADVPPLD